MKKALLLLAISTLLASSSLVRAESPQSGQEALKAAESKLARCYQTASKLVASNYGAEQSQLFKQSQEAWEKYRDLAARFERGDAPLDDERTKDTMQEVNAFILLRLVRERTETIQRRFGYRIENPSEIRVQNASGTDFKGVIVGDKKYGDIKSGATTDYQHWEYAFSYAYVSLSADSKPLKIQPIDFMGDTPLGEGKFTYLLTIKKGELDIKSVRDDAP